MDKLLSKIINSLHRDNFIDEISSDLSGTEFNSLMLEIYRRRSEKISANKLMLDFEHNRFVQPLTLDTIQSRKMELDLLQMADSKGFEVITLSPLTPLGTCSVIGTVNQNKIISGTRGTEVVSDATNVLQLKIAQEIRKNRDRNRTYRYATVHRHVRAQHFNHPLFSAHFSLLCMASGGYDQGDFVFEKEQLKEHISVYLDLIGRLLPGTKPLLEFYLKEKNEKFRQMLETKEQCWSDFEFSIFHMPENAYYKTIQFKIFIMAGNEKINIADGGIVDWLQQLTGNRKLRSMISAAGIELIQKLSVSE